MTDRVPDAIVGASKHDNHSQHTLPETFGGPGELMHAPDSRGVQGGPGRGSPADLAPSQAVFAARDAQSAYSGVRGSLEGLGAVHSAVAGAGSAPALSRQLDFSATGQFGMGIETGMAHAPVLRTPALKGQMQSQHAQHPGVHASIPGPLVPDPPTVLPTAPDFGTGRRDMRVGYGGLHDLSLIHISEPTRPY